MSRTTYGAAFEAKVVPLAVSSSVCREAVGVAAAESVAEGARCLRGGRCVGRGLGGRHCGFAANLEYLDQAGWWRRDRAGGLLAIGEVDEPRETGIALRREAGARKRREWGMGSCCSSASNDGRVGTCKHYATWRRRADQVEAEGSSKPHPARHRRLHLPDAVDASLGRGTLGCAGARCYGGCRAAYESLR